MPDGKCFTCTWRNVVLEQSQSESCRNGDFRNVNKQCVFSTIYRSIISLTSLTMQASMYCREHIARFFLPIVHGFTILIIIKTDDFHFFSPCTLLRSKLKIASPRYIKWCTTLYMLQFKALYLRTRLIRFAWRCVKSWKLYFWKRTKIEIVLCC